MPQLTPGPPVCWPACMLARRAHGAALVWRWPLAPLEAVGRGPDLSQRRDRTRSQIWSTH